MSKTHTGFTNTETKQFIETNSDYLVEVMEEEEATTLSEVTDIIKTYMDEERYFMQTELNAFNVEMIERAYRAIVVKEVVHHVMLKRLG